MAARAVAAAVGGGRRMVSAGRSVPAPAPLLASSRSGAMNRCCSASVQPEDEDVVVVVVDGAAVTGAQVEAELNRKNVEVLQGEGEDEPAVTENPTLAAGVLLEGADDASTWVPDQETGVFGPADAETITHGDGSGSGSGSGAPPSATTSTFTGGSSSVLDQTVFVREDDMEDVERPPMANTDAGGGSDKLA